MRPLDDSWLGQWVAATSTLQAPKDGNRNDEGNFSLWREIGLPTPQTTEGTVMASAHKGLLRREMRGPAYRRGWNEGHGVGREQRTGRLGTGGGV